MKKIFIISLISISVFLTGCSGKNSVINKVECRTPNEPGCEECISKQEDGQCVKFSWHGYGASSNTEPWFNSQELSTCKNDLPACASCFKRDEIELLTLLSNKNFDKEACNSIDIGIDPCIAPNSQACLCNQYIKLSTACPLIK